MEEEAKRKAGAAIAPPQALVEADSFVEPLPVVSDNTGMPPPSFTPSFGGAGKGLGVAANIMTKLGYKVRLFLIITLVFMAVVEDVICVLIKSKNFKKKIFFLIKQCFELLFLRKKIVLFRFQFHLYLYYSEKVIIVSKSKILPSRYLSKNILQVT